MSELSPDFFTKHVADERIAQVLGTNDPETAAQSLIDAALEGGGSDNVTVVVARGNAE